MQRRRIDEPQRRRRHLHVVSGARTSVHSRHAAYTYKPLDKHVEIRPRRRLILRRVMTLFQLLTFIT